MANRRFTSQFAYSFERMKAVLAGAFTQSGSTGSFASRTTQGVTLTANVMGSAGNSITIAFTGGGTAGAEVVTVTGTAISVQIQSGVSTVTQVRTAINASVAAAALVTATGTSAATVATASALALTGGADTVFTNNLPPSGGSASMTLTQTGVGTFKIALADPYQALISVSIILQRTAAADLNPQIRSVDTSSAKAISFSMNTGATPTSLASGDVLYIDLSLRNSSS